MILVDTSIWIEFFKKREPYFHDLRELIELSEVLTHEVIFAELLQGCKNNAEISFILNYWENLKNKESEHSLLDAGIFSYEQKLINKDIGLIDSVIINTAKKNLCKIWTLDKKILKFLDKNDIFQVSGRHSR